MYVKLTENILVCCEADVKMFHLDSFAAKRLILRQALVNSRPISCLLTKLTVGHYS